MAGQPIQGWLSASRNPGTGKRGADEPTARAKCAPDDRLRDIQGAKGHAAHSAVDQSQRRGSPDNLMLMIRHSRIASANTMAVIAITTLRGVTIGSDSGSMMAAGAASMISTQRATRGDCAGPISTQRSIHDVCTGSSSPGNICDIDSRHFG